MIAAGTSAPIPIAARQKPANQSGNILTNKSGTTLDVFAVRMPAARAMKPSSAINPSSRL